MTTSLTLGLSKITEATYPNVIIQLVTYNGSMSHIQ